MARCIECEAKCNYILQVREFSSFQSNLFIAFSLLFCVLHLVSKTKGKLTLNKAFFFDMENDGRMEN